MPLSQTNSKDEDERKTYQAPYTEHHPIPTIKHYKEEKDRREDAASATSPQVPDDSANTGAPLGSSSENKNMNEATNDNNAQAGGNEEDESDVDEVVKDTSEAVSGQGNPKDKRKEMKHKKGGRAERVVTDPVTHLPLRIHDFTDKELEEVTASDDFLQPDYLRSGSDLATKGQKQTDAFKDDAAKHQRTHREMERLFPPPEFDVVGKQLERLNLIAVGVAAAVSALIVHTLHAILRRDKIADFLARHDVWARGKHEWSLSVIISSITLGLSAVVVYGAVFFLSTYTNKKVNHLWEAGVWDAERMQGKKLAQEESPESTHWLNSVLASIWPLINPDLFISLSDTLEDVMQASLPKLVRMVSVDDIGQGSEAFRILGVKWLPRGAARHSVGKNGKLQKRKTDLEESDRTNPASGSMVNQEDNSKDDDSGNKDQRKQEEESDQNIAEGMQAEEGDFINLEVGLAYKARFSSHGMRTRSNNPHLYLAFYLPGNIKLPIWVQLRGFIGILRLRLQLTPDPPFFSICTMTFLGQPKVDLSCFPLIKRGLNIMNLPLISNFVQSSIDAAMAEFVAPKSLTLDLKDMMVGEDFKKDTLAHGVIVVRIKKAYDFKEGDASFGPFKKGSTDGYVTVGWAKFGKPVWSSRVISADMDPVWEETAYVLVSPQELNVRERLRVQLWDSDRMTADDDLGRIEVDLQEIMTSDQSRGKMWDRQDGFRSLKAGEGMPGKLEWSVGYYEKTKLLDSQLLEANEDVNTVEKLRHKVNEESERKLREASKDESDEIEQQKAQDFKERQDQIIISTPPPKEYPSGILSIVVHQIQGLELETPNKANADESESLDDEQEQGDDLPSSYCTIILNHQQIYKTRTKPKNSQPFFNAGTERFVPDIQSAHVHVAVRDSRIHEDDSLIGIVDLPLKDVFEKRSQINDMWPLSGGIGYGHLRISMVFRSIKLQIPREFLGWEYGTLDVEPEITANVGQDLQGYKIKLRTSSGSGKFYANDGVWKTKDDKPVRLPVKQRYSSVLTVEFHSGATFGEKVPAFAILRLKDIPDDEDKTINLTVWKGDKTKAQINSLEVCGEDVGSVSLKLKFWHGLSGYHVKLAKKDPNIEQTMEVLDCANDVNDDETMRGDDDDDSSDSSGSEDDSMLEKTGKSVKKSLTGKSEDLASDGKRGPLDQARDYKRNQKQLHRKNKGLMQWKIPRTLRWAQRKIDHTQQKVADVFDHHKSGAGVETEV